MAVPAHNRRDPDMIFTTQRWRETEAFFILPELGEGLEKYDICKSFKIGSLTLSGTQDVFLNQPELAFRFMLPFPISGRPVERFLGFLVPRNSPPILIGDVVM